jgi:hypothetical protein
MDTAVEDRLVFKDMSENYIVEPSTRIREHESLSLCKKKYDLFPRITN